MRLRNLREWRLRRTMTQRELAEASGITQATISRLEKGQHQPLPSTIRKLAMALQVTPDDLVGDGWEARTNE